MRIAALRRGAVRYGEGAETKEADVIARRESVSDGTEHTIDRLCGLGLGQPGAAGNGGDKVVLVYSDPLRNLKEPELFTRILIRGFTESNSCATPASIHERAEPRSRSGFEVHQIVLLA